MAIAFRSAGTAVAHDVGTGNPVSVPTPAGFAAGDCLLMVLCQDSNTNETSPAGWTLVGRFAAGTSGFYAAPTCAVYVKTASGSEGASVNVTYNTGSWPVGDPYVVAFMLSYTGVNTSSPVEIMSTFTVPGTGSPAAAEAHPQVIAGSTGDWLLTLRTGSSGAVYTCTDSVGTDVQRQIATGFSELTLVAFDSNAGVTAGTQTVRTTTLSGVPVQGTGMATLLLRPAGTSGAVNAAPGVAAVTAAALAPTVSIGSSPWSSVCGPAQYPAYAWAIDWALSGMTAAGKILNSNPFLDTQDLTGWSTSNSTLTYAKTSLGLRTLPTMHVVPNGSSASGGPVENPHSAVGTIVPGQSYIADGWVYSPGGWADLRACIDWYDSSDTFLSTGLGVATAVTAGTWTRLRQTLVAPASASRGSARARFGSTPAATNDYYVWGLKLMDPSQAETRITPDATAMIQTDLLSSGVTLQYGRDQARPLSPGALGTASFTLTNKDRVFSPEYTAGPLYGTHDAARPVRGQVVWNGVAYSLFSGYIDDYTIHVDRGNRSVDFAFQDAMSRVQNTLLTTPLYQGIRTGAAINAILDAIKWPGPRDIDLGATIMPYWWLEQTSVTTALQDLVLSEGHPATAYSAPDGTFVFRDRTHRLVRTASTVRQATFTAGQMTPCPPPTAPGLSITEPFTYAHGWRDICNYVVFSIAQRAPAPGPPSSVWQANGAVQLAANTPVQITATTSDPFLNAVAPSLAAGDFTVNGAGSVTATIGQTSGQSTVITLVATGGAATVNGLRLRAVGVPVVNTAIVTQSDTTSINQHGQQAYPNQLTWAGLQDAQAIAQIILLRYAQKRPSVQITVPNADQTHYQHMLQRTVSDLIHLQHDEMGINADFYVENVGHTIQRMNQPGLPPVHEVTLGCEEQVSSVPAVPFTFDARGQGFDNGMFCPQAADSSTTVWIWDNPAQSVFNTGLFGT